MLDEVPSVPCVLREDRLGELAGAPLVRTQLARVDTRVVRALIAALRVNVIASTRSGRSTRASNASRR